MINMTIKNLLVVTIFALSQISTSELPGGSGGSGGSSSLASGSEIQTILSIIFTVIGSLAVLVLIISGISYMTSGGDAQKVTRAKDGILYALVGIVVAASAEAIVAFVLARVK